MVSLFSSLRSKGIVTFTRSYMHLIFSTGVCVSFTTMELLRSMDSVTLKYRRADVESWWSELFQELQSQVTAADVCNGLSAMEGLLQWMSANIPGTMQYTHAFVSLKARVERHLRSMGETLSSQALSSQRQGAMTMGDMMPASSSRDASSGSLALDASPWSPARGLANPCNASLPEPDYNTHTMGADYGASPWNFLSPVNGDDSGAWIYGPEMEQFANSLMN